jgi:hypothetical protein
MMNKKILYLTIAVVIVLLGTSAVVAAPKPNVWDSIADLQTSVTNLWGNATEQQNAIDAIQPGTSVRFGNWNDGGPYVKNTMYTATSDGFVCAYCYLLFPSDPVQYYGWTGGGYKAALSLITGTTNFGGLTFPVREGDSWRIDEISPGTANANCVISWLPLVPGT